MRCFKCQSLGHIAFECPNRRVVALIEEEKYEDRVEDEVKKDREEEDEEEVLCIDQGLSIIVQCSLKVPNEEIKED